MINLEIARSTRGRGLPPELATPPPTIQLPDLLAASLRLLRQQVLAPFPRIGSCRFGVILGMLQACCFNILRALNSALVVRKRADRLLGVSNKCLVRKLSMAQSKLEESRGALIVLEGLDRCGKTSQSGRLFSSLEGLGYPVELWRFPDRNTGVGQMISSYLSNQTQLDDRTIHLLFSANRWEKRSLMESKLRTGTTLIVDRYSYSGVAFSSAKGLDFEWCKAPENGLLAPDLVLYLDIKPEKAAERGGYGGERYEQLEFQKKVSQQYQMMRDHSWKIIDASLPMEDIEKHLIALVLDTVKSCSHGKPLSQLWSGYLG